MFVDKKQDMKIEIKITDEAGNVQLCDVSGSLLDAEDDMILKLALGMTEEIHGKLTDVNEHQNTISDCYDFIRHFVKSNDR
jgi:hypothetical protein